MPRYRSALECFLQLAGDFVGRGIYGTLHDPGGPGKRLVDRLLDGRLADRDEPSLVGSEVLSRLVEFLARQRPAPKPLRDDTDARAVHPLDDVGLAVLLVDHGSVVGADRLVLVQLLDGTQIR